VKLGLIESVANLCFFCVGSTLNGQIWSIGVIGVTMRSVDLQQRPIPVTDWGHNHKGSKLIYPHIQHKYEVRTLNQSGNPG
jgi:hypothetical protein